MSRKRSRTGTPTEEPQARRPEVQGRWPAGTRGADLGEGLGVAGRSHTSPDTTLQGSGVLYEQPATLATAQAGSVTTAGREVAPAHCLCPGRLLLLPPSPQVGEGTTLILALDNQVSVLVPGPGL